MNTSIFKPSQVLPFIFSLTIVSFPIFSLIIRGWVSAILFTSSFFAVLICWFYRNLSDYQVNLTKSTKQSHAFLTTYPYILAVVFCLPLLSVALSQILNSSFNISRFDSPSRYIIALVIFFVILQYKNSAASLIEFIFPLSAFATFIFLPFLPKTGWAALEGRLSVFFIDPLIFGQLCLAFGVLSLFSIGLNGKRAWWITAFKLAGAFLGIYLSLMSQSRTGWLAVPVIFLLWILSRFQGNRLKVFLIGLIATTILSFCAYQWSGIVKDRVNSLMVDVSSYQWNSMNEYSSIGARISWIRIGFHYFKLRPISGWEDASLHSRIDDPEITIYANEATRDELMHVGFHNDYISNMVHYGILGLASTILIFLIPLIFFSYCIFKNVSVRYARLGIAYVLIQSTSSLSYHILDFKFMASFYALMIVVISGMVLTHDPQKTKYL